MMPSPRSGGAGKKTSPSIFTGSFAQLRLHAGFATMWKSCVSPISKVADLPLPCQPWGEATLKKHPHLSDLKKWLERYGFCTQQVRIQMG